MKSTSAKSTVWWHLVVGLAFFLGSSSAVIAKSSATDGNAYTAKDKEYYLTANEIYFIRPGLEVEIVDVAIPGDMRPEVTFSVKDPGGLPLDVDGIYTPGAIDFRYTLTAIPQGEEQKVILLPAGTTSERSSATRTDGVFTPLGDGMYSYKFLNALPDSYDPDATVVVGVAGRRDLQEFELDRYPSDDLYAFVPSGNHEPQGRDIVREETCNGRCHDPLQLHGRYRKIDSCTQCHNPTHPSGPVYSFNVMVHKIHDAQMVDDHDFTHVEYPAEINDCETCHTGGTPTKDFPLVANPSPVPVCDFTGRGITTLSWDYMKAFEIRLNAANGPLVATQSGAGSKATGKWVKEGTTFYLIDKATGNTVQKLPLSTTVLGCVGNAPGTFRGVAGAQHTNWLTRPTRAVCGSCHDDVDFVTGENHPGGALPDDRFCTVCHQPDSGKEFDRSVRGAHTQLYKSKQFPGVLVKILDVFNTAPGANPTVKFSVGSKSGRIDPASLNRLLFTITGPNDDFSFYVQEDAKDSAVRVGETDLWTYTFDTPLPADATGSYSVSFEGREDVTVTLHGGQESSERNPAENYLFPFAVTDSEAVPRRTVVEDYNCEGCHRNLSLHGNNRRNPQYCDTCHRPNAVDIGVPAEGIHFKWMIHKIHRGEDLENGYTVVRSRGTFDFSNIEFPGDLRNCEKCHVDDSYTLPLPDGLLPTSTSKAFWEPLEPIAAACLSCHDDATTAAHADANTTFFGESCSTCHGVGKEFDVEKVHAR